MATILLESRIAWARPRVADYPSDEARTLESETRKTIEGEVRFDTGSRALYATDGSNCRRAPIGVVVPKTMGDVLHTVEKCRRFGKYDLSMQIYNHQLGARLRATPSQKLVVADGFSCKIQIEQAAGGRPLHLAQLLDIAKHGGQAVHHRDDALDNVTARTST